MGSGKDIGKDKPAFGWELEPFVAFGSISGNVLSGKDKTRKECENMRWPCGLRSSTVFIMSEEPLHEAHQACPKRSSEEGDFIIDNLLVWIHLSPR